MNWSRTAQYVSDILALILVIRLAAIRVRLPGVYRVFVAFLTFQLLDSLVSLALYAFYGFLHGVLHFDYRLFWMPLQAVSWVLSLWMVYALLSEILKSLPGILRFSRVLLNVVFAVAVLLALLTVFPEYSVAGGAKFPHLTDRLLIASFAMSRAIAMAALLVLACILAFILWFPVEMHRNLAAFSVGLVIYFTAKVGLFLARSYLSPQNSRLLSTTMAFLAATCLLYWIVFITRSGQAIRVRWGHSWRLEEQRRLMTQLESTNTALLRSTARR
jgi:hypothetical protein